MTDRKRYITDIAKRYNLVKGNLSSAIDKSEDKEAIKKYYDEFTKVNDELIGYLIDDSLQHMKDKISLIAEM